jgi:hypothetical protein
MFEVENLEQRRESLHHRGEDRTRWGGAEIEIAKHVPSFDARPKRWHAKQRDPKGAMETGGL